jgi:hypothetical protein
MVTVKSGNVLGNCETYLLFYFIALKRQKSVLITFTNLSFLSVNLFIKFPLGSNSTILSYNVNAVKSYSATNV